MRAIAPLATVAALALAVALAPESGAQSPAHAQADAVVVAGYSGRHVAASTSASGSRHASSGVDERGVTVRTGEATARSSTAGDPSARASAVARSVSLLGGRVSAYGVRRSTRATGDGVIRSGRVDGLRIDGRLHGTISRRASFRLSGGDGRVLVNRGGVGLQVILTRPTDGLPGGADLRVAVATASVRAATEPTPTPTPSATPSATPTPSPKAKQSRQRAKRRKAPSVRKRLTRSGFAFPVYGGKARVADNYGATRAAPIVSHEGDDIFAPFGSPVVAVADGTLSKVGTLPISGNRLWVTTAGGDAFFYAHLSAFSPAAVNGAKVKAGDVLGFVGNTGDAEPTPPHVHFEVHPGGLEQPSVDPYPIVTAWQGRRDVAPGAFLRRSGADTTQRPGSLVTVRDFIAE